MTTGDTVKKRDMIKFLQDVGALELTRLHLLRKHMDGRTATEASFYLDEISRREKHLKIIDRLEAMVKRSKIK